MKMIKMFNLPATLGLVLICVSIYLPWAKVHVAEAGITYDGKMTGWEVNLGENGNMPLSTVMIGISICLLVLVHIPFGIVQIASAIFGLVLGVISWMGVSQAFAQFSSPFGVENVHKGMGQWLIIGGTVLFILGCLLRFQKLRNS